MFTGLDITPGTRYASYDGDADRIVFYYFDQGKILSITTDVYEGRVVYLVFLLDSGLPLIFL